MNDMYAQMRREDAEKTANDNDAMEAELNATAADAAHPSCTTLPGYERGECPACDAANPIVVEIPADVRDNSETVTNYAFMGHRSPDKGVRTPLQRETEVINAPIFGYMVYTWRDTNPGGQRCAFTMTVDKDGTVTNLFHTEYFTRTACAECAYSYASVYQVIPDDEDPSGLSAAVPRCDEHADRFRQLCVREQVELFESERLRIGQHD